MRERKYKKDGQNVYEETYDSIGELLEATKLDISALGNASRADNASEWWDLNCGFEGAQKMLAHGWEKGAASIKKISAPLVDKICQKILAVDWTFQDTGHAFDMGKVMSGEPECWLEPQTRIIESQSRQGVIRIVASISANYDINAEQIKAKGAILAALIESLEAAGRPVELIACGTVAGYDNTVFDWTVPVKSAGQPLDLPRVAFVLAHPAFLRRIGFIAIEHFVSRHPRFEQTFSGYGSAHPAALPSDIDCGAIPINDGEAWILRILAEQGIEIKQ